MTSQDQIRYHGEVRGNTAAAMGRIRSIVPLSIATVFGILNGVMYGHHMLLGLAVKLTNLLSSEGAEDAPGNIPSPNEARETSVLAMENASLENQANTEPFPKTSGVSNSLWSMIKFWEGRVSKIEEEALKSTDTFKEAKPESNR
ncbi:MAG: hypothetical protein M1839_009071 [Geoglossum umbratile]|nr:MAG: hypothetical protein M1839_009071 [Geoglossum umbratile]